MVKARWNRAGDFFVQLDGAEQEVIALHGDRESLGQSDALADVLEHAIALLSKEIVDEENEARRDTGKRHTVTASIELPEFSDIALLTEIDIALAKSVGRAAMLESLLDSAMKRSVLWRTTNVMEREDERVRSGKPTIPVNGSGVTDIHSSGGPGLAQGQV